jgi:hypothetical protein
VLKKKHKSKERIIHQQKQYNNTKRHSCQSRFPESMSRVDDASLHSWGCAMADNVTVTISSATAQRISAEKKESSMAGTY